jgi:hypothetical protein
MNVRFEISISVIGSDFRNMYCIRYKKTLTRTVSYCLVVHISFRVLVGNLEGKRPLGRPRRRWEDNIKINLQEVGGVRGDWMEMAQDRDRWRALVGTVRDFRVP